MGVCTDHVFDIPLRVKPRGISVVLRPVAPVGIDRVALHVKPVGVRPRRYP